MSLEWIIGCVALAFVILLIILAGVVLILSHVVRVTFALDDYEPYGECPAPQWEEAENEQR